MSGVTSGLEFSMLEREEGHVFTHCFMATLFLSQAYIYTCCQENEINSSAQYIAVGKQYHNTLQIGERNMENW